MNVGIVGAGFTGLSSAFYLTKKGHEVVIFEKDEKPGGLAVGYREKEWDWSLERHYHHWFTNDYSVLNLAKEIKHKVIIERPKTSSFVDNGIFQFDSPSSLLKFPKLNMLDKIRMGLSLSLLRYNPFWKPLENFRAESYLKFSMGTAAYEKFWEPLMKNKLGKYANDVSLAWFWARVYKRTESLAYPEGGFLNFAEHLQKEIEKRGGKFYYDTEVLKIKNQNSKVKISIQNSQPKADGPLAQKSEDLEFDKVIVTLPSFLFLKIAPDLPSAYTEVLSKLKGIGAINIVLRLKEQFLRDGTYWLNMCEARSPILAIVEHTNFMDKEHYNNEHIVYFGNYLEPSDPRFKMTEEELLKLYDPWLKKINPTYQLSVVSCQLFKTPFAQPIIPLNYSKIMLPFETPFKNVYLANIQQVYPWDRGTNYAVELGEKAAEIIDR